LSNIVLGETKQNMGGNGKTAKIYYQVGGDRTQLYWQTPEMYMPFGLSMFDDGKVNVDLSFIFQDRDAKTMNPASNEFHKKLEEFEDLIVSEAVKNSQSWLKMKAKKGKDGVEVVRAFFTPLLKKSKNKETLEPDGKYPDSIRLKIYKNKKGEWDPVVWDTTSEKPEKVDLEDGLQRMCKMKAIMHVSSVWLADKKYGVTLVLKQAKITNAGGSGLSKYGFKDDSGSEEEEDDDVEDDSSEGEESD